MRALSQGLIVLPLLVVFGVQDEPTPTPSRPPAPSESALDVVTLLANDPLRAGFNFQTGRFAGVVQGGELHLEEAHLVFDLFERNMLTIGHARFTQAGVLDLGEILVESNPQPDDVAPKPAVDFFYSLAIDRGDLVYAGPFGKRFQISEAEKFLRARMPEGLQSFRPLVSRTYVLRHRPPGGREKGEVRVRLRIIDFEPARFVTFRWAQL